MLVLILHSKIFKSKPDRVYPYDLVFEGIALQDLQMSKWVDIPVS